jgi:hypothetical protein
MTEIRQKPPETAHEIENFRAFFWLTSQQTNFSVVAITSVKPTTCSPTDGGAFISPSNNGYLICANPRHSKDSSR